MKQEISKLSNNQILSQNKLVRPHLPETRILSIETLRMMLDKYKTVYIKPNNSCQGKGVMRVDRKSKGYSLKTRDNKGIFRCSSIEQVMTCVKRQKMKRVYIIQRGISSYTEQGRLFDIRVHLLRIEGKWQIGGIIGRVANRHGVATNAYSGGTPVQIKTLMDNHLVLKDYQQDELIRELSIISLEATKSFSQKYPKWTEIGLDIGMDQEGHLWIYEINIKPGMLVFRKDRPSYKRIMEMKKRKS